MMRDRGTQRALIALGFAALLLTLSGGGARHPGSSYSMAGEPGTVADRLLDRARRIRVNTAGPDVLERLPGVGPTLARRLIADRAAHGLFRTPEELQRVPGIGPKLVERLRAYVSTD